MHGTIGEHEMRPTNMITTEVGRVIIPGSRGGEVGDYLISLQQMPVESKTSLKKTWQHCFSRRMINRSAAQKRSPDFRFNPDCN